MSPELPIEPPAQSAAESHSPETTSSDESEAARTPVANADAGVTTDQVKVALRRVKDPEINLNIVDLGLVYDIVVDGADVRVDMSLTSPGCPSGPEILGEAEAELRTIEGIGRAEINLVWSPPWSPERIEPRVRAYLGF